MSHADPLPDVFYARVREVAGRDGVRNPHQLAVRCGISSPTARRLWWASWRRARGRVAAREWAPKGTTVLTVADAFGVSLDWLLGRTDHVTLTAREQMALGLIQRDVAMRGELPSWCVEAARGALIALGVDMEGLPEIPRPQNGNVTVEAGT